MTYISVLSWSMHYFECRFAYGSKDRREEGVSCLDEVSGGEKKPCLKCGLVCLFLSLCGNHSYPHRENRGSVQVRVWCMPHSWPSPWPALKNRRRHPEFIPWTGSLSRLQDLKTNRQMRGKKNNSVFCGWSCCWIAIYSDCICHKRGGKKVGKRWEKKAHCRNTVNGFGAANFRFICSL